MGELAVADDASTLSAADLADLRRAVRLLESNHLLLRMTALFGRSFNAGAGFAAQFLPQPVRAGLHGVVSQALLRAVSVALLTMKDEDATRWRWLDRQMASRWFGSASVAVTGAGGGAGGLASTLVEFPITTTLMMRTILQIARDEGEDLGSPEARLNCLQVFALGGPSSTTEAGESSYYMLRMGMAELLSQTAGRTLVEAVPRLTGAVATRFGVPAVGAATGALINVAFIEHFRQKARGHFIVRRLERRYGESVVRAEYRRLVRPVVGRPTP